jgi:dihydrofolate synthase/folylpolyglutamate synthase
VTQAFWPGRLQRLTDGPLYELAHQHGADIILDGGHNPAAGAAIADHLRRLDDRPTYLICGMLNTKDVTGYLRPLASVAKGLFAVAIPDAPATLPPAETVSAAKQVCLAAETSASVEDALKTILAGGENPRILICGSLYLIGAILRKNAPGHHSLT